MTMNICGKTKDAFYLVAVDSLENVWDLQDNFGEEIDFLKNPTFNEVTEGKIFFIEIKDDDIKDYLDSIKNTPRCPEIPKDELLNLKTLYVYKKENNKIKLYIQRIMASCKVEKSWLAFMNNENLASIEKKKNAIFITNCTHVFYNQATHKIYFRKFSDLESVFPKLKNYYREAEYKDLQDFQDSQKYPFLKVNIELDISKLNKTTLKHIALIIDKFKDLKPYLNEYKNYANKYNKNFVKNDRFEINKEKDIEYLENIMSRKIYTTEAGKKEAMVASWARPL